MTYNQSDRLDRIEQLLEQSAIESARRSAESDARMTRLEQQQEQFWVESRERLRQTEQIANSNARSIQALADAQAEDRLERQELRDATARLADLAEGMGNWITRLDENQPTILARLRSIEGKVDRLLERDEGQ